MSIENQSSKANSTVATVPWIAALISAALGASVLLGWTFDVPLMRSVLPGAVEMKPNTAIALCLSGCALFILDCADRPARFLAGQVLAFLVVAIGLATLSQYMLGWNLGIDELVFRDNANAFNAIRGRMSPYSTVSFIAIGLALAAMPVRSVQWARVCAASVTTVIGTISLLGYLWNATEIVTDRWLPPVAVNTAIAFVLLGVGVTLAGRARGSDSTTRPTALAPLETKVLYGFLGGLVLLLAAGAITSRAGVAAYEAAQVVAQTQAPRLALANLYAAVLAAESAERGYLLAAGSAAHKAELTEAVAATEQRLHELARTIENEPTQSRDFIDLRRAVALRIDALVRIAGVYEREGLAAAQATVTREHSVEAMHSVRDLTLRMESVAGRFLAEREAAADRSRWITLVAQALTLALAIVGVFLLFRGVRREMAARLAAESALRSTNQNLEKAVADLLAANHFLDSLIDNIPSAILVKDPGNLRLVRLNKASEELLGQPKETLIGKTDLDLLPGARADRETAQDRAVLAEGAIRDLPEEHFETHAGQTRVLHTRKVPVFDERGQALALLAISEDVTDVHAARQEILKLNDALKLRAMQFEQASKTKSEFLATMSHELRTPLNAIIGFSEALRDSLLGSVPAPQLACINDIHDSGEHLLSLINDILDLSKVEAGHAVLEAESIELKPLLSGTLSIVKERAHSRRLKLTVELADDLPPAWVDERKLKQIVYNLLSNAVKFTLEGGRVTLRARRLASASGDQLEIAVIDTGIGISPEDQALLFQPFVQLDGSLSRSFQGTGLGLALVKAMAELHGGGVAVRSARGEGSTFTVCVPYFGASGNGPSRPHAALSAPRPPRARPLALIVEDEVRSAELLRIQLDSAGFDVLAASDAESGLVLARDQCPDVITLDLMLPGMDGADFLLAVKSDANLAPIPVVVISIASEAQRALALGAADVLQKPVDRQALNRALDALGLTTKHLSSPSAAQGNRGNAEDVIDQHANAPEGAALDD
jgi:PAS domain S-box-containing protein